MRGMTPQTHQPGACVRTPRQGRQQQAMRWQGWALTRLLGLLLALMAVLLAAEVGSGGCELRRQLCAAAAALAVMLLPGRCGAAGAAAQAQGCAAELCAAAWPNGDDSIHS